MNLKTVRSYLFQVHNATVPLLRISIADALFGKTQQAVLGILFSQPERSFYLRELVAAAGSGASQVQKELSQLAAAGLVTRERKGNQVWFRANPASPVFAELKSIIAKTTGIADVVRAALLPFEKKIDLAFIYGSVARGEHDSASDIDLLIVGPLAPSRLAPIQLQLGEHLGRPVRPVVYSADELRDHARQREHFIRSVLNQPKIWLVGSDKSLKGLLEQGTRQSGRRKLAQG